MAKCTIGLSAVKRWSVNGVKVVKVVKVRPSWSNWLRHASGPGHTSRRAS